jgi:hypothetical protein
MARQLLKDVDPLCAAILDGNHDSILDAIAQSVAARQKRVQADSGIRKNAFVQVEPEDDKIGGRIGRVLKVNRKTVSIRLMGDAEWITWNVSHNLLTVVPTTEAILDQWADTTRGDLANMTDEQLHTPRPFVPRDAA